LEETFAETARLVNAPARAEAAAITSEVCGFATRAC
jgi:hypothetical protein